MDRESIRMQAIEWFVLFDSGEFSETDQSKFERWLNTHPQHRSAYAGINASWGTMENYGDSTYIAAARKQALADTAEINSELKPHNAWQLVRRNFTRWNFAGNWVAQAAVVAVVSIGAVLLYNPHNPQPQVESPLYYETTIGQLRTLSLQDGSSVTLDTNSRIAVNFSANRRNVHLQRGQAHFTVHKDSSRLFTVVALNGSVTALGTAFDVKIDSAAGKANVIVTLIEGSVKVLPHSQAQELSASNEVKLHAGQQVSYSFQGISAVNQIKIDEATSWRKGKLVFNNTLLLDALNESNRYSEQKLLLGDKNLSDIRISGVFKTGEPKTVSDALVSLFPIRASRDEHDNIIFFSR